jgi:hypothetical protein
MKIIKQFEDQEFFKKRYRGEPFGPKDKWIWGLAEDGGLWYKNSFLSDWNWHSADNIPNLALSIKDMKRIVKEFGHLLAFL